MHQQLQKYLLIPFLLLAMSGMGQNWTRTIELKDRRKSGKKGAVVGSAKLSAYYMENRIQRGTPVSGGAEVPTINFKNSNLETYIKIKVDEFNWDVKASGYDKTPDFKIVVRSLWVDMDPRVWTEVNMAGLSNEQKRRRFIQAPNIEYVFGDSLPPPFIFKLNRNGTYRLTIGFKTITPETKKESPFYETFTFKVEGMQRDVPVKIEEEEERGPSEEEIRAMQLANQRAAQREDSLRKAQELAKLKEEERKQEVAQLVAIARENEDIEELISLIKRYPGMAAVEAARKDLALQMRRELIDTETYRIDIEFERFSSVLPKRDQIDLSFVKGGRVLGPGERPAVRWTLEDELFVTPPVDGQSYTLLANMKVLPEKKGAIVLNSVKDNIFLSYRDTLKDASAIAVNIRNGQGPYKLFLELRTGDDFLPTEGYVMVYGDTILRKDPLARKLGLSEAGEYRVIIEDSDRLTKTGKSAVFIDPPPPIPPIVWYLSIGGLVIFFVGYRFWVAAQRRKDEEMEKLISARGGRDPKVKRKPKPELTTFWNETAISDLSLHKNFIEEIATYLKERRSIPPGAKPVMEGLILGTVLKFDFENEQYEVRLDRFRAIEARALDHYENVPDREKWPEIQEVTDDHKDLVKIGWLQVVADQPMALREEEMQFQDEQFSELFQLLLKIDLQGDSKLCGFFTRTISGKLNNADDRARPEGGWMDWDRLEDAGYYENDLKPFVSSDEHNVSIKNVNKRTEWA